MRTRHAVLAIPAVLAMGVLAGCSGSTGTDDAGPTPSPAASSASPASGSPTSQPTAAPSSRSTTTPSTATPSTAPASSTAAPSSAPAGPPLCATDRLRLSQGKVEGAAGSTYVTYFLQNVGSETCVLDGHPGFALLRANGSVIQHPADRGGPAPTPVRVAPGKKARFVVRSSDPGTVPEGQCSYGWKTAQVQVYPPDQTTAIRQPSDIQACNLVVDPVTAP